MFRELEKFITLPNENILTALKKIDRNLKGFLVVTDDNYAVLGTLTDGDLRRAFIANKSVEDTIETVFKKDFTYLKEEDGLSSAIDIFKRKSIKFLPILDKQNKLLNIITKSQLHALLLQDIHADLRYNFLSLDEQIVDYEVFQRPWGFYKTTVYNEYYQSKVINVYPKSQLSLQSHSHREEHWIVVHGKGIVQIGESFIDIKCGSSLFIPKGCKHRLSNTDDKESLIITEVQIGDYLGEDDIVRYEDIYGRK